MDKTDVEKLAQLARIKITDAEAERLVGDLGSVLGYVSELKEVVAEGSDTPSVGDLKNVMREDVEPHEAGFYTEDILREVPEREGSYLKVKKIL